MTIEQFKTLHKELKVNVPKTIEINRLDSATDPTQDIPIKNIELAANGEPINVRNRNIPFNNIKVENFTSIERRHTDSFDQLGELQSLAHSVAQPGVTSDFINEQIQKKHES